MSLRGRIKFSVPKSLEKIKNSIDSEEFLANFDELLCLFMSPVLFVSALGIPLFGFFALQRSFMGMFIDFLTMTSFAISFEVLLRIKVKTKVRHHIISILYSLVLIFAVVRFYSVIGPAIWTFAFIQIVLSLSQNSKVMLMYSAVAMIISGIFVSLSPKLLAFQTNIYYAIVQFALFALLYFVAKAVYDINNSHYDKVNQQLNDLKREAAERKKAEEKSLQLAMYDQLTGLPNRSLFSDRLKQSLEFSARNGFEIYVMFIDIDAFKLINDTLGHHCGDELLIQIGERLSGVLRGSDAVSRVSGDEFLVMLMDVKDRHHVTNIAQRMLERISEPFEIQNNAVNISCSIGISKFPEDAIHVESLIKRADIAMYKAKQDGKNRYAMYSEDLEQMRFEEMELVNSLQNALANDEFRLHYQPQINGATNEVIGFEALVRWEHPTRGFLGAGQFVPVAEKTGLIVPIGDWVLKTACKQNKVWQDEGMKPIPMAVNISINQFTNSNLYSLVQDALKETGLDAKYLELEITETMLVKETKIVNENLRKIRNMGVKIAIDDFGTGYSAIQYLKSFPIDRIKIPMNFIHGINNNIKDESIISVMLALAQSLDIGVVAEGVETKIQLEFLMERLCSTIQGYFFCKPMAANDIAEYVKSRALIS